MAAVAQSQTTAFTYQGRLIDALKKLVCLQNPQADLCKEN